MDVGTLSVVLVFYILLFHFLIDASGIFGCFLRFVDNLHVDRYWVLYHVPVCDMGYFSIIFWGVFSCFLSLFGLEFPFRGQVAYFIDNSVLI